MAYADQLTGAQIAAHAAYSQATAGNLIAEAIINGVSVVRNWISTRKGLDEMRSLDDHLLRDIGLNANDVGTYTPTALMGRSPRI